MDDALFDDVAEATRALVPAELGVLRLRPRRWAVKVWFGPVEPIKEHYEVQILGGAHVPEGATVGIEVGFHAEHPKLVDNDACLARINASGETWRTDLGGSPEVGGFIGRADQWRRISEVWVDPDLADPGLAWELAMRLTDYIVCLEPLRAAPSTDS